MPPVHCWLLATTSEVEMNLTGALKEMLRDFRGAQSMHTPHGDATALEIADSMAGHLEFLATRSDTKRIMPIAGGEIEIIPGENETTQIKSRRIYVDGTTIFINPNELLALAMLLLERHNDIGVNRINTTKDDNTHG